MESENNKLNKFNEMVSSRSFFFPSAEIYPTNFAGFYEYGPIGNKIKINIIDFWRNQFVKKNNFFEISGSIILPEVVFKASGHLENFNEAIGFCTKCKTVYRLDKLLTSKLNKEVPENLELEDYIKLIKENNIVCDNCKGNLGNFSKFNLMSSINVGVGNENKGYLRGETCQSIFLDFLRVYKTSRENLPIGISQHGKVYRNEIAPRNGLLRGREFEQLESELFFDKDKLNDVDLQPFLNKKIRFKLLKDNAEKDYTIKEIIDQKITLGNLITYYLYLNQEFLENIGFKHENFRFREVPDDDRAFYSLQGFDLEIKLNDQWIELFCTNYRGDHDLLGHSKGSKKDLSVSIDGKKILPHVLEVSSIGLDRLFYLLLYNSFETKIVDKEERNILHLKPKISPYFVGVLPLVKKDGLLEKAQDVFKSIQENTFGVFDIFFDEKASIGRRYARLDEIGTNFCITIDYQTMEDDTVTIRDRETFAQKRISIKQLPEILLKLYEEKVSFEGI